MRNGRTTAAGPPERILRFRVAERRVHWALAIPFLVCYVTALALVVVYNPDPLRPYREIVSWTHRISGVCLIVIPALAVLRSVGDLKVHFYNIRQAWVWVLADMKWLLLMAFAAISKRVRLPEQGKFNAAQKLNFMMVMSTYPLYIVTGLMMWISGTALLAWLVHFGMALIATPFILGHVFMATIPPSTRKGLQGMFSGLVDRQWAKHHHGRWYRENFERGGRASAPQPQSQRIVILPSGDAAGNKQPMRVNRLTAFPRELESVSVLGSSGGNTRRSVDGGGVNGGNGAKGGKGGRAGNGGNGLGGRRDVADAARLLRSDTLRAIVIGLRDGQRQDWVADGRAAVEAAAREGDWELAAGLFRELWPDVREMNLNREEMRAIIMRLKQRNDLGMAAKASAVRIMQDPNDSVAIDCMLKAAEASLRAQAWKDAIKIYEFLVRHCFDSPYAGYFSRGIELAEQWSRYGGAPTAHAVAAFDGFSETDPEARV